jgi:ectoine hydroxylase-related dioxygenase (phytanoyl-CoA dioxygenase family)
MWPKQARILPTKHVEDLKKMAFYQTIRENYGDVSISDDELNWRLVRPHAPDDVGPVHADRWFWNLGYGRIPQGWDRFKIWIPIFSEPGLNGLCVKPFSHLREDWKHHTEVRGGMAKPVLDEDVAKLNMQLLQLSPGEMVLFHDALLHGGVVNRGNHCRVSLELTIFFHKDFQARRMRRGA